MKSNLQKEKRKKYVRLKKNFGWRILCAVGIIFSAVSLLTGCRMEQWEADISEKTEKSIRVSKPMQASLDVVAFPPAGTGKLLYGNTAGGFAPHR